MWSKRTLKEVCEKIGSGATPKGGKSSYKQVGISLVRSQNVLDFIFTEDGLAFIDEDQANRLSNVTLKEKDVLLNITGDSVARVCQIPSKYLPARVNQHVSIIRSNQTLLNPSFLKYYLLSPYNKNRLLNLSSAGATRKAITKSMIEDFSIDLPPLPEQKAIASVLSAIDDKIELNLQMNQTLEEMAMTLYKHWFVDFGPFKDGKFVESDLGMIPEGWEIKGFLEIADLLSGGTPKTKVEEYWNGSILWVSGKDVPKAIPFITKTEKQITHLGVDKSSTKVLPENTVILVARGSVGNYCIIDKPMAMNQSCYGLFTRSEFSYGLIYCTLVHKIKELKSKSYGSVFDTVTTNTLKNILVISPTSTIIKQLKEQIDPMFEKMKANSREIDDLSKLRDTLLPKLISGEVRLKEFRN